MVADQVDVISRRAGSGRSLALVVRRQGRIRRVEPLRPSTEAPARGTRVVLHLMEDAKAIYRAVRRSSALIKAHSGHVPVPIAIVEKPGAEPAEIADGAALWTKPKSEITPADYTDFYRSLAGQFDEPALTIHFRAEGRHEYTALAFMPGARPFDLFDPDRKGRIKLYVKRVFITDDAEILPRYLRFVRGLVDSADLPLNVSREMIQESPLLAAIRKGVTSRVLSDLEKLADNEPEAYGKIWDSFGAVLKEGLYEDFERRDALLKLARFKTTASRRRLAQPQGLCRGAEAQPDRDLLSRRRRPRPARRPRRSSKASAPAASRCCCCPIRSTASGSRRAVASTASRSSR